MDIRFVPVERDPGGNIDCYAPLCDEILTSALDVSVQARVLDLLEALKHEFGIAYLFISHDMAVVENIADRLAVMYLGQIVEMGSRAQIFGNPQHPYTRRLIEAVPVPDPAHVRAPAPRPVRRGAKPDPSRRQRPPAP